MKNIFCLGLVWVFSLLGGCARVQPLQHTVYNHDSTVIHEKLVPIHVPGSTVTRSLSRAQYDSLVQALKALPPNKTIYLTDPKYRTQLEFMLDSLGRLRVTCETLEKDYIAKLQEKDRTIEHYEKEVIQKQLTFWQEVKRYVFIALGVIALVAVLVIIGLIRGVLK